MVVNKWHRNIYSSRLVGRQQYMLDVRRRSAPLARARARPPACQQQCHPLHVSLAAVDFFGTNYDHHHPSKEEERRHLRVQKFRLRTRKAIVCPQKGRAKRSFC